MQAVKNFNSVTGNNFIIELLTCLVAPNILIELS